MAGVQRESNDSPLEIVAGQRKNGNHSTMTHMEIQAHALQEQIYPIDVLVDDKNMLLATES